jgi:hypothetical protein
LTFFRSEHYLLVFYPTAKDLASVLLAAMAIGEGTAKTTRALSRRLRQRVAGIRSKLSEAALETLRKATRKFPTENATQQMMAWAQTVELAAGRGGLLACGDLSVAADLTQRYPTGGQLTVEARVADLMSYCVSEEYEALRRSVGAAIEE